MTNKFFIVMKHEFRQKLRSRAFIVLTFIGPILFALVFLLPMLLSNIGSEDAKTVALVNAPTDLAQRMNASLNASDSSITVTSMSGNATTVDSLNKKVVSKALFGYVLFDSSVLNGKSKASSIHVRNPNDMSTINKIQQAYQAAIISQRMHLLGIDTALVGRANSSVNLETIKVTDGKEEKDNGGTFVLGYITGFILYMTMLLYGTIIMRSVIEEKSSRVLEIVASSIDPFELLLGKVLGVGLAGLFQISMWAIMLAIISTIGLSAASSMLGGLTFGTSPFVFIYFIGYFVFGYLIYSTLYAALGAMADQESDVQQMSIPITILIMIPIFTLNNVIQNPNSVFSTVLSLIPFFSPILMLGRIFSETPPVWQIALSFVLMGATFFGVLKLGAKIYRVGILMYGKKPSLPEVRKWIRYS